MDYRVDGRVPAWAELPEAQRLNLAKKTCIIPGCSSPTHHVKGPPYPVFCVFHWRFAREGAPIPPVPSEAEVLTARELYDRGYTGKTVGDLRSWLGEMKLHSGFEKALQGRLKPGVNERSPVHREPPGLRARIEKNLVRCGKERTIPSGKVLPCDENCWCFAARLDRALNRAGHVYFISVPGRSKVGTTHSIHGRGTSYRQHGARPKVLAVTTSGGRELEGLAHELLKAFEKTKEWFDPPAVSLLLDIWEENFTSLFDPRLAKQMQEAMSDPR